MLGAHSCISALAASGLAMSAGVARAYDVTPIVEMFDRETRERCNYVASSNAVLRDQIENALGDDSDLSKVKLAEFGLPWWYVPWMGMMAWLSTSNEDRIAISTIAVSAEYLSHLIELVNLSQESNRDDPEFREKQDAAIKRASELLELVNCLRLSDDEQKWMSAWVRQAYEPSVGGMECGQWFDAAPELLSRLADEPAETHLETFNDLIGWPNQECREGTRQ